MTVTSIVASSWSLPPTSLALTPRMKAPLLERGLSRSRSVWVYTTPESELMANKSVGPEKRE